MQQVMADPDGASGTPKAASSSLEPLPLHTVSNSSRSEKVEARPEMQLWTLRAQVTPPCSPVPHPRTHPRLSKAPTPGPLSNLLVQQPRLPTTKPVQPSRLATLLSFPQKGPREATQGGRLEPR